MRGSPDSIAAKLGRYGAEIIALRERGGTDERPLWIDLGCGRGEFASLLEDWGWRVQGVDSSASAVDECRANGIRATRADVFDFLEHYAGEAPLGMSAIQLIEHLPKERWLAFFEDSHRVLGPGGVLLVETINPLETTALTSAFFADVTHTWPAHPETLKLMALHAGFARAETVFLESEENGEALDYAIWAWVD